MDTSVCVGKFRVGLAKEVERYTSEYHALSNNVRAVENVVATLASGKDWRCVVPFGHGPVSNQAETFGNVVVAHVRIRKQRIVNGSTPDRKTILHINASTTDAKSRNYWPSAVTCGARDWDILYNFRHDAVVYCGKRWDVRVELLLCQRSEQSRYRQPQKALTEVQFCPLWLVGQVENFAPWDSPGKEIVDASIACACVCVENVLGDRTEKHRDDGNECTEKSKIPIRAPSALPLQAGQVNEK